MRIDLNADVGESFGAWSLGEDEALIPSVTSINVACGAHAGDPRTIDRTIALALEHGVAIGAHPGYPDLAGFGRRAMDLSPDDIEASVLYQVAAVAGFARAHGTALRHVKAHGALYNLAARDGAAAAAIARAVQRFDPSLALVGLAGSALLVAGRDAGLRSVPRRSPIARTSPTGRCAAVTMPTRSWAIRTPRHARPSASRARGA